MDSLPLSKAQEVLNKLLVTYIELKGSFEIERHNTHTHTHTHIYGKIEMVL